MKSADLVVCSGGDIFTSDYFNLQKHLSFPVCSKSKVYLCSHTIGPFSKKDEVYFKKCLKYIDAISVREKISYDYVKAIAPENLSVTLVSDVAFTLNYSDEIAERIISDELLLSGEKFVALAISKGIVRYSGISEKEYIEEIVKFSDYLACKGHYLVFIPHVMERNINNNDSVICREIMTKMKSPEQGRVMGLEYSASEFKSVIGRASCLVGARTHATIASMSQRVPTVSIAYSRKAYGIVKDVYGEEHYMDVIVDAKNISSVNLIEAYEASIALTISKDGLEKIKSNADINFSLSAVLNRSE